MLRLCLRFGGGTKPAILSRPPSPHDKAFNVDATGVVHASQAFSTATLHVKPSGQYALAPITTSGNHHQQHKKYLPHRLAPTYSEYAPTIGNPEIVRYPEVSTSGLIAARIVLSILPETGAQPKAERPTCPPSHRHKSDSVRRTH